MSFVLGLILFVGVIGVWDARLPWPRSRARSSSKSGTP
jgi:hypothetical protein